MGVGTADADADADARSTRGNLEADAIKMHCERQSWRQQIGVCMLRLRICAKGFIKGLSKGRPAPELWASRDHDKNKKWLKIRPRDVQ